MNTDDLEKLLSERERIAAALRENEKALLDRHTRESTVMFTDIVGSTRYFEQHGDVEGMKLLHRHNELLFPVVERNRGHIIKTIGDAILATFESPREGVRAAIQMHQTLREANARRDGPEIHIRAGLHHGRVFLANNDVFGDTVNTAARVVHAANPDEVLVSQYLYSKIPKDEPLVVAPRGALTLKGKAEPFAVVGVDWHDAIGAVSGEFTIPAAGTGKAPELFVLDISTGANGLKVSAIDGDSDKGTVKAYGEQQVSVAELTEAAKTFATFMHAGGEGSYVPRIRAEGEQLFARAMTERARRHLRETKLNYLRLHLDDALVHVPWELMHDGKEFLGVRFALGRHVATRTEETVVPSPTQSAVAPPYALVVANPSGDLPAALNEGETIAGLLQEGYSGKVTLLKGPLKKGDFLGALKGCTVLHFAGHIQQPTEGTPGGFVLADGLASPSEVHHAVGETALGLVFANGCHATSGRGFSETARGVSDLASALLIRGCRHFIGPSWAVNDNDALTFALRFYEKALAAISFGESVRSARASLLQPGHQPLSFAGYVLYGDPRKAFAREHTRLAQKQTRSPRDSADALDVSQFAAMTAAEPVAPAQSPPKPVKKPKLEVAGLVATIGIALAFAAGLYVFGERKDKKPDLPPPPPKVATNGQTEKPPDVPLPAVIHEGPIRLTVLSFKNVSGDQSLEYLEETLAETVTTDFSGEDSIKLIERGQISLNLQEIDFGKGEYVDKATRAEIGKIKGAEVAVLGGYQRAGPVMRANARFVNVETGEVLHAVKVERPADQLLDLQDTVAAELRAALPTLTSKLRK